MDLLQWKTYMGNVDTNEMLVCFCHGVTEAEIRKAILDGAITIEAVREKTCANTGCGGCLSEVERIIAEVLAQKKAPSGG